MASKKTSNKTTASKGIISSLDVVPNRTQSVQPVSDANSAVGFSVYPDAKKNTTSDPTSNLGATYGNPYKTGTPLEYNTYTFTQQNPLQIGDDGLDDNTRNILTGYEQRLNNNGYLQALESARKNTLDATNKSYNDNARNYYQMYMTNQAKMPENLSRLGVTGGASETAQLGLMNNYSGNLYNNESQRAQTTANLNAQYDQLVADYSKDLAQQLANAYYDTANTLQNRGWQIEDYNNQGVNEQNKYNTEIQNNANATNWQRANDVNDMNVGYQLSEMSTLRNHGWDLDAELRQRGYAVEDRDLANSLSMAQYVAEYSGNTDMLKKVLQGMGMTKKQAKAIASDFTKAYNKAQESNNSKGSSTTRSGRRRSYYSRSGGSPTFPDVPDSEPKKKSKEESEPSFVLPDDALSRAKAKAEYLKDKTRKERNGNKQENTHTDGYYSLVNGAFSSLNTSAQINKAERALASAKNLSQSERSELKARIAYAKKGISSKTGTPSGKRVLQTK